RIETMRSKSRPASGEIFPGASERSVRAVLAGRAAFSRAGFFILGRRKRCSSVEHTPEPNRGASYENPAAGAPVGGRGPKFPRDAGGKRDVACATSSNGSNSLHWWTRLQPIRTASEIEVEFPIFTREPFGYHRIRSEARTMRK